MKAAASRRRSVRAGRLSGGWGEPGPPYRGWGRAGAMRSPGGFEFTAGAGLNLHPEPVWIYTLGPLAAPVRPRRGAPGGAGSRVSRFLSAVPGHTCSRRASLRLNPRSCRFDLPQTYRYFVFGDHLLFYEVPWGALNAAWAARAQARIFPRRFLNPNVRHVLQEGPAGAGRLDHRGPSDLLRSGIL